jgi:hypothetical protein
VVSYVASPGVFLCCRLTDSNNFVGLITNSGTGGLEVWKRVAGTYTNLMPAVTVALNDLIRLETQGTTWRAYRNGTLINSGAIGAPSLTSTRQGFVCTSTQTPAFDNYQAGLL